MAPKAVGNGWSQRQGSTAGPAWSPPRPPSTFRGALAAQAAPPCPRAPLQPLWVVTAQPPRWPQVAVAASVTSIPIHPLRSRNTFPGPPSAHHHPSSPVANHPNNPPGLGPGATSSSPAPLRAPGAERVPLLSIFQHLPFHSQLLQRFILSPSPLSAATGSHTGYN